MTPTLAEIPGEWAQPPAEMVAQLPKGGTKLDYVGHASVTKILLDIDPEWDWQPFALDEKGLPALDAEGNLWINLTILGKTRPGVGDGKNMKERVGDALRNAAMRFGIALALWAKEDWAHSESSETPENAPPAASRDQGSRSPQTPRPKPPTAAQKPFCTECGAEIARGEKKQGKAGEWRHVECPSVAAVQEAFEGAELVDANGVPVDDSPF